MPRDSVCGPIFDDPVAVHIADIIRTMNIYGEDETETPEPPEEEEDEDSDNDWDSCLREERSGYCLPESYDGPSYVQGYPQ